MGLDANYFRATGVRFSDHPIYVIGDDATVAERVRGQNANIIAKSRAWTIALCKTSGGLFYKVDGAEMVIFPDNSYLTIIREHIIDLIGKWPPGYVERYASAFERKNV